MTNVFVSYSRLDGDFAYRLAKSLSDAGHEVWLDTVSIPPGVKWHTAIQNGLKVCEALVLIVSPNSVQSQNVEDEWRYFRNAGKTILPVQLKPAEVHFQLIDIQYVDFFQQDYDRALGKLLAALAGGNVEGRRPGQENFRASPPAKPGRWAIPALVVLMALIVMGILLAQGAAGGGTTPPAPANTTQPTVPSSIATDALFPSQQPTTVTLTPSEQPAFTAIPAVLPSAIPTNALPLSLTIERGVDTVAVCSDQAANLASVELNFGRNERYVLGDVFGAQSYVGDGGCLCLQQTGAEFPAPDVCQTANTKSQPATGDWRNADIAVSYRSQSVGECAAQPGITRVYSCQLDSFSGG